MEKVMKLVICLIIAAVCVTVIEAKPQQDFTPPGFNHFLLIRSRVSQQQFTSQIATGQWLSLYSVLIGDPGTFEKAKHIWRVSETQSPARLRSVNGGPRFEKYYSQDPSKYFWWFICITPGTTPGSCTLGFFDLVIKDTRTDLTGDLNLVGLPWDRIAADLKAISGLTFANPAVTYVWTGTECPNP